MATQIIIHQQTLVHITLKVSERSFKSFQEDVGMVRLEDEGRAETDRQIPTDTNMEPCGKIEYFTIYCKKQTSSCSQLAREQGQDSTASHFLVYPATTPMTRSFLTPVSQV